ncbi:hypothetical protein KCP77_06280 [Salmonella enterica subsp. enterica]|nr:hypothetical protein KCP77_06280 [Salmonella enterica subsp. enterica]
MGYTAVQLPPVVSCANIGKSGAGIPPTPLNISRKSQGVWRCSPQQVTLDLTDWTCFRLLLDEATAAAEAAGDGQSASAN